MIQLVNPPRKLVTFVEQEIYASLTTFKFANRVYHEVVVRQSKDAIYA